MRTTSFLIIALLLVTILILRFKSAERTKSDQFIEASNSAKISHDETSDEPSVEMPSQRSVVAPIVSEPSPVPRNEALSLPNSAETKSTPSDRFGARHLDRPLPQSITELREEFSEYTRPILPTLSGPSDGVGDGDVLAYYRGFYEVKPADLRRVEVDRTSAGVTLMLDEEDQGYHEWSEARGDLHLRNFNHDAYSLVLQIPDGRIIYLKYKPGAGGTLPRSMSGWLISAAKTNPANQKMAVIDSRLKKFKSGPDAYEWPGEADVVPMFPRSLLAP